MKTNLWSRIAINNVEIWVMCDIMLEELEEKIEELDIKRWSLAYKGNQVFADFENDVYLRLEVYGDDGTKKKWLDWIEPTSAIWDVEDDDHIETNFVPISDPEAIRDIKKRIVYDISPQYKERGIGKDKGDV